MNNYNIFTNQYLLFEIASYLTIDDKVMINNALQMNCFLTCNFTSKEFRYKNIGDIASITDFDADDYDKDSELCEYLGCLSSDFVHELDKYYDDYCGYDTEDYMNDWEYNNISYEKIRNLSELCLSTYTTIYARKLVECIENKKLSKKCLEYDIFELDNTLDIDIHTLVTDYYKAVFTNKINIDIFCYKCGTFGHHSVSKNCVFYNKYNENKRIREEVKDVKEYLLDKITANDKKDKLRSLLVCISCKVNNKSNKCPNNNCRNCCTCSAHSKKGKVK
jgi:hypothetical protein